MKGERQLGHRVLAYGQKIAKHVQKVAQPSFEPLPAN